MNRNKIIVIIVAIAALILTIFNVRSIIVIGIKRHGVTDEVPTVIRKNYLDAIVALTDDESIYEHFSIYERTDDAELVKKYPLVKTNDICIYDGKDYNKIKKLFLKEEAFLFVSKNNFANKKEVINEYNVLYYVKNAENNGIKDIYKSVGELNKYETLKYAKDYVLDEYKAIGISLTGYQVRFILLHVMYELLYVIMVLLAVYYAKKNRLN